MNYFSYGHDYVFHEVVYKKRKAMNLKITNFSKSEKQKIQFLLQTLSVGLYIYIYNIINKLEISKLSNILEIPWDIKEVHVHYDLRLRCPMSISKWYTIYKLELGPTAEGRKQFICQPKPMASLETISRLTLQYLWSLCS